MGNKTCGKRQASDSIDPRSTRKNSPRQQPKPSISKEHTTMASFHFFPSLTEDLKMNILSFVADAPFESDYNGNVPQSSLTHSLPLVCKEFHRFCNQDELWKSALMRQITQQEPKMWKQALQRTRATAQGSERNVDTEGADEDVASIIRQVVQQFAGYKALYKHVISNHFRFSGPVFCMGGQVNIGEEYGLHFFEPRYRVLIAEVMSNQPEEARRGGPIVGDDCVFIHANRGPLAPTTPATLVKVTRCEIFADGRANVELMPIAYVWLEKVWVKPNTGHLYYAQCFRMGEAATKSMNQLARQEQLAYIMSHLADHLVRDEGSSSGDASGEN